MLDLYGRSVTQQTRDGKDVYTVSGGGDVFEIAAPVGTSIGHVMDIINSMSVPSLDPPSQTIWPYEFQGLLSDSQLSAIQLSTDSQLIRLRTKLQTIVSPMPWGEGSEIFQAIDLLSYYLPALFTTDEVTRIKEGRSNG